MNLAKGCGQTPANGQLNRKIKVVREPKSIMDMVIPCEAYKYERVETNGDECNQ